MRLAIFSVKYSPNLGDGLLSECLEHELRHSGHGLSIVALDLAGRRSYGSSIPNRKLALRLLELLPAGLRRLVARVALTRLARHRLRPFWRDELATCDAAVIGGGNLFADADLNFPMKINAALAELTHADVPVAVSGVGVTRNWSDLGRRLFADGLARSRVIDVTVRDTRSQQIWNELLGDTGIPPAGLSHDPGLLTSVHFPSSTPPGATDAGIGFCITDPVALRYHAPPGTVGDGLIAWYGQSIAALASAGHKVSLFTNGSPEDEAVLGRYGPRWAAEHAVTIMPRFARPADFAGFIARCEVVIAHRMHACIAAHSYGIPAIGLAWDLKLDSFFASTGRAVWLLDPARVAADALPGLVARARIEGVDRPVLDALIQACRDDVARLGDLVRSAAVQG